MRSVFKSLALLVGACVILTIIAFLWVGSRGISARAKPGRVEIAVARTMRHLAVPRVDRNRQNPVPRSPEVIAEGMAHYADHCAACHANDGSGETEMGRGLYPKPPDMRLPATQSLTDGELFYIIENGVRLTGMPAWGTGTREDQESTWHLVHFIRELTNLTPEKIEKMKQLNPLSPAEVRQQIEEEKFLSGADVTPPSAAEHAHPGAHK